MPQDPVAKTASAALVRRMCDETFDRLLNGTFDADVEHRRLSNYLSIAQSISDPPTIATVYNTLAIFSYTRGDLTGVFTYADLAIAAVATAEDLAVRSRALMFMNNKAAIAHNFGDAHSALQITHEMIQHLNDPDFRDHAKDQPLYLANQGSYHITLSDYRAAADAFDRALNDQGLVDQDHFTYAMGYVNLGRAEIALHEGDHAAVEKYTHLAHELAMRQADNISLQFLAHCALGHLYDYVRASDASAHYDTAIALNDTVGSPILRAVSLIHEARFHHRHARPDRRMYFANLAAAALQPLGSTALDSELQRLLSPD